MAGKHWTPEEINKLMEIVSQFSSVEEIVKFFPGRTASSIQTKVERLKLKYKGQRTEWTEEEIDKLIKFYKDYSTLKEIQQNLLPNRTIPAIQHKMDRLGISVKLWSDEEIKKLKELYPNHSNEFIAAVLGRSKKAIDIEASRQRLKKDKDYLSEIGAEKFRGKKHTKETKDLMKIKWDERKSDPNWKHSWLGRKHSEETKEKLKKIQKEYYAIHESPFKGRKHTEETKKKMRKPRNWKPGSLEKLAKFAAERNHFKNKIKYITRHGEEITLDSSYELRLVRCFDKYKWNWKRNVTEIKIPWYDSNGRKHFYFPDFILWMNNECYIIEAKGEHLAEHPDTLKKAEVALEKFGDRYILCFEEEIKNLEEKGTFFNCKTYENHL